MRIAALVIALILTSISYGQKDRNNVSTTQKFDEVLTYVSKLYVDDVNSDALTDAAIIGLLEKLDPHSTYISKEEVNDANERINGNFVGIGIRFQILKDTLMVVATIPGGPSEKLGLMPGDKIIKIENESVAGTGLQNSQVREKLLGDRGTKVKVEIQRKKTKNTIAFVITRDVIPVNSVDASYMINDRTGYIKLNSFSRTSLDEVQDGIRDLKKQGMENLIFDLQGNGGGLLYTAKYLADEFLSGDKLIVYSEGRAQPRSDLRSGRAGLWEGGKLVLLTDEYSASASEILSGAIQDWDRGLIVGRRTYGKGLVQRPIDLTDGSQMRLTIARYFTPSGRFIQKPYEDKDAYRSDLLDRYENGEFMHQDSIKMPDSLMFETMLKHRKVYGGGGIMPDYFVPLDTMEVTDYFSDLIRSGHVNSFALSYINDNREAILTSYPEFKDFKNGFATDKKFMDEFFEYVDKEDEDDELEFNQEEYDISAKLLKMRMKAILARNLWGYSEFYQIYNDSNEILQKAIEVIESDLYDQAGLK
ncbi:MAG: carboxyl-terminal processing protease [Salibacteraceae bacterium]|jgi:carboxyl-terminal processing protease